MSWSNFLDKLPVEITDKILEYVFNENVINNKKHIIMELDTIKCLIDFCM